ncbi:hypothetical protein ABH973_001194 [Bradyrhizobium ottawaense]|nr:MULTISPECIES: hypothetical protein [Bradyrhizobium]MBR1328629.1 hypothetical protein [Bradyrhizobium ottawaense]MBR1360710.1 hypothetical protein [Bradyrhizobium ottawaense]
MVDDAQPSWEASTTRTPSRAMAAFSAAPTRVIPPAIDVDVGRNYGDSALNSLHRRYSIAESWLIMEIQLSTLSLVILMIARRRDRPSRLPWKCNQWQLLHSQLRLAVN